MRQVRGGRIAMIFQEPMTALNPVMTIGRQIDEMVEIHLDMSAAARRAADRSTCCGGAPARSGAAPCQPIRTSSPADSGSGR